MRNGWGALVDMEGVTPPREILENQPWFVTFRAVNRSFRFVPTKAVCEIIWYCLAVVCERFAGQIALHEFLWMSNHAHLALTDITGCLPDFMRDLNSLISRALNGLRGTTGTNIEKGYNAVAVNDGQKLLEHCVYTLANPCAANLVDRSRHWKGVSSLRLEYDRPVTIERPSRSLWADEADRGGRNRSRDTKRARHAGRSKLPKKATLVLTRPEIGVGAGVDVRTTIRERLAERENELIAARKASGTRVLGWRNVIRQHFADMPRRAEERFGSVPTVSASSKWARAEALKRRACFLAGYYTALERFMEGVRDVVFPLGTWLMKRRFGVTCCPLPAT